MTTRDAAILSLLLSTSAVAQLSPEERRGSQIYLHGTSPSGKEIVAVLDNGRTRIPGGVVPCANCHGQDGRGKPEGGVLPPDVTWEALTKPYGVVKPDRRSHPPYTDLTLKRAITMGIDSGGRALDPMMPRFRLSYEDATSLLAFLKRLGSIQDPGISDSSVRIGVILPVDGEPVRTALTAYFDQLNSKGGIFNRRVDPAFWEPPGTDREAALRQWLGRESIFALIGAYLPEAGTVLTETTTPLISAFAVEPDLRLPLNPYVFYLEPGSRAEVEQLTRIVGKLSKPGRAVIVRAPGDAALSEYAGAGLTKANWKVGISAPVVSECRAAASTKPTAVLWLASAAGLRACASSFSPDTRIYIPNSFVNQAGLAEASAKLLTLALQKTGRTLTRQKLIESMEGVYDIGIGAGFNVSYGPNRRVGGAGGRPYLLDLHAGTLSLVDDPTPVLP